MTRNRCTAPRAALHSEADRGREKGENERAEKCSGWRARREQMSGSKACKQDGAEEGGKKKKLEHEKAEEEETGELLVKKKKKNQCDNLSGGERK